MPLHMQRILTGIFPAIVSIGVLTGPSSAEEGASLRSALSPDEVIKLFDVDGDKKVSRPEVRTKSVEVFDRIDGNKDGVLSATELPSLSATEFMAADKDRNGKLTVYEYSQAEFLRFEIYDRDKDGFITAGEIVDHRNRAKAR